ncbi:MAG TPA: N-acetylglucosamine-6-phosphate deacetylase [Jatrophihabitantaceae bacterium]|nr:N-acetylglucosamine-6-phosphate deacetylase [Jatrophihabitantaceae bacterium]
MTVLTGARVVTPSGVLDDGWVRVDASTGRIDAVCSGALPAGERQPVSGWLLPGFIDVHVHGGGGYDFTASADDLAGGVAFHRRHGTTGTVVSLMAGPVDAMCEQLGWVTELARDGAVLGAHLEGPFLAPGRCGAQNPAHLLAPDLPMLGKLLDAGQGFVRTMTVAPELDGAGALIGEAIRAGVIAAIGHTTATYEQARAGFDAGANLATHLFNAMGPISQRAPGPAIAALDAGGYLELINDGVHVHESLVRLVARLAPDRLVLITDSISAAGMTDGHYRLGDRDVHVTGGRAQLEPGGALAGSTLTMAAAVRHAVDGVGLPIELAAAAAATNPAALLGLSGDRGAIASGLRADLVLLDDRLAVDKVMVAGSWI